MLSDAPAHRHRGAAHPFEHAFERGDPGLRSGVRHPLSSVHDRLRHPRIQPRRAPAADRRGRPPPAPGRRSPPSTSGPRRDVAPTSPARSARPPSPLPRRGQAPPGSPRATARPGWWSRGSTPPAHRLHRREPDEKTHVNREPALLAVDGMARHVQNAVEAAQPIQREGQVLAGLVVDLELAHRDALAMHRRVEPAERLEREQPQDVARGRADGSCRTRSRPGRGASDREAARSSARGGRRSRRRSG